MQELLKYILPAAITGVLTYLATRHKQASDDTKAWWEETRKIREEMRAEITRLQSEIRELNTEKAELEKRVGLLENERDGAHDLLKECISERDFLRAEIKPLREENEFLHGVVNALLVLQDMRDTGREPVEGAGKQAERILTDYLKKIDERDKTTT